MKKIKNAAFGKEFSFSYQTILITVYLIIKSIMA